MSKFGPTTVFPSVSTRLTEYDPVAPAGVTNVRVVELTNVDARFTPPKTSWSVERKPEPEIVTVVPPAVGATAGEYGVAAKTGRSLIRKFGPLDTTPRRSTICTE